MDMYADDLISREELNDRIGGMRKEIERLENELKMVSYHLTKGEQLEAILNQTFREIEDIADVRQMTNAQLKRIIQKIEVDKDGKVDIYLRLFGDLGLDEIVLICHDETVSKVIVDGWTMIPRGTGRRDECEDLIMRFCNHKYCVSALIRRRICQIDVVSWKRSVTILEITFNGKAHCIEVIRRFCRERCNDKTKPPALLLFFYLISLCFTSLDFVLLSLAYFYSFL